MTNFTLLNGHYPGIIWPCKNPSILPKLPEFGEVNYLLNHFLSSTKKKHKSDNSNLYIQKHFNSFVHLLIINPEIVDLHFHLRNFLTIILENMKYISSSEKNYKLYLLQGPEDSQAFSQKLLQTLDHFKGQFILEWNQ